MTRRGKHRFRAGKKKGKRENGAGESFRKIYQAGGPTARHITQAQPRGRNESGSKRQGKLGGETQKGVSRKKTPSTFTKVWFKVEKPMGGSMASAEEKVQQRPAPGGKQKAARSEETLGRRS